MQQRIELTLKRFGLEMQIGCKKTASKTKCDFSPLLEVISKSGMIISTVWVLNTPAKDL
jgi:hypothetical protein